MMIFLTILCSFIVIQLAVAIYILRKGFKQSDIYAKNFREAVEETAQDTVGMSKGFTKILHTMELKNKVLEKDFKALLEELQSELEEISQTQLTGLRGLAEEAVKKNQDYEKFSEVIAELVLIIPAVLGASKQIQDFDQFFGDTLEDVGSIIDMLDKLMERQTVSSDPDVQNFYRVMAITHDTLLGYRNAGKEKTEKGKEEEGQQ
jgi:hypothetical protein